MKNCNLLRYILFSRWKSLHACCCFGHRWCGHLAGKKAGDGLRLPPGGRKHAVREPHIQLLDITRILHYTLMYFNINLKCCRRCSHVCGLLVELCGCRGGSGLCVSVCPAVTQQWGLTEAVRDILTKTGPIQPFLTGITIAFKVVLVTSRSQFLFLKVWSWKE